MPHYAVEIRFVPTSPGGPVKQDETLLVHGKNYYYLGGRSEEVAEAVKTILGLEHHVPHVIGTRVIPDTTAEWIKNVILPKQDEINFTIMVDKRGNIVQPTKKKK